MKRMTALFLILLLCLSVLTACNTKSDTDGQEGDTDVSQKTTFNITSLKGPTTMGMAKLMSDAKEGNTKHNYNFEIYGTADEAITNLASGKLDIALLPCNVASVLYHKTEGAVQVAAINTLSVLYVVENGDTINSVKDLVGKTIYSTGKGTTPEFAFNYILNQNGIDPQKDLNIEYKSESAEIAAILQGEENNIAILPEPYITTVQMKNEKVRTALSFNEEWNKVSPDSSMVTGVLVVRKDFIEENNDAFIEFLDEYKSSTEYVNANADKAGEIIAEYGIVPDATIASMAIPDSSIVYIDGKDMKTNIEGYLKVLFDENPQSIGGALPEDDFYFIK